MATAFLFSGSNGSWSVHLHAHLSRGRLCGATFRTKAAAVAFLTEWGFEPAIGDAWARTGCGPCHDCLAPDC